MPTKKKEERIGEALLKVALGCRVEEVTEEYAEVDGAMKLTKRRETKKDIPPDLKAVQLLLSAGDKKEENYGAMTDEELEAEKARLFALLREEIKNEQTAAKRAGKADPAKGEDARRKKAGGRGIESARTEKETGDRGSKGTGPEEETGDADESAKTKKASESDAEKEEAGGRNGERKDVSGEKESGRLLGDSGREKTIPEGEEAPDCEQTREEDEEETENISSAEIFWTQGAEEKENVGNPQTKDALSAEKNRPPEERTAKFPSEKSYPPEETEGKEKRGEEAEEEKDTRGEESDEGKEKTQGKERARKAGQSGKKKAPIKRNVRKTRSAARKKTTARKTKKTVPKKKTADKSVDEKETGQGRDEGTTKSGDGRGADGETRSAQSEREKNGEK